MNNRAQNNLLFEAQGPSRQDRPQRLYRCAFSHDWHTVDQDISDAAGQLVRFGEGGVVLDSLVIKDYQISKASFLHAAPIF